MPRRLVDVLVDNGADSETLHAAAADYYRDQLFGEWLVERGLVTPRQLALALAGQAADRGEYGEAQALLAKAAGDVHESILRLLTAARQSSRELADLGQEAT